mgnify:CR=1 FL=1
MSQPVSPTATDINGDDFLTAVGPQTPGGQYLRRYWHPFLLASELKDLPVPVRLLGEDLIAFRDSEGLIGMVEHDSPSTIGERGQVLGEFGIR